MAQHAHRTTCEVATASHILSLYPLLVPHSSLYPLFVSHFSLYPLFVSHSSLYPSLVHSTASIHYSYHYPFILILILTLQTCAAHSIKFHQASSTGCHRHQPLSVVQLDDAIAAFHGLQPRGFKAVGVQSQLGKLERVVQSVAWQQGQMGMEAKSTFVHEALGRGAWGLVDPVGLVGLEHWRVLVLWVPLRLDIEVCVVDKVSWLVDTIHCGVVVL